MPAYTTTDPRAVPQPAAREPDKTARYMERLEDHLGSLPPPERLPRLADLKSWWIAQYEAWADRVDRGAATASDMQCSAFDFRLTIDAVSARHAQEAAR